MEIYALPRVTSASLRHICSHHVFYTMIIIRHNNSIEAENVVLHSLPLLLTVAPLAVHLNVVRVYLILGTLNPGIVDSLLIVSIFTVTYYLNLA